MNCVLAFNVYVLPFGVINDDDDDNVSDCRWHYISQDSVTTFKDVVGHVMVTSVQIYYKSAVERILWLSVSIW